MTAVINGIVVTGTVDEIHELILKANTKPTISHGTGTIPVVITPYYTVTVGDPVNPPYRIVA